MNRRVIKHLYMKLIQDWFWLVEGKERKIDIFSVTFTPSSYSALHQCSISFTCSVFLLSPNVFHLLSLFPCNLLGNADCRATCNRNSLSWCTLPFLHTGMTCLFQSPFCFTCPLRLHSWMSYFHDHKLC